MGSIRYEALFLILLMSSFLIPASRADIIRMPIRVVDKLGRPLQGASVSVTRPKPAPSLLWMGETDSNGGFTLGIEYGTPLVVHVTWMGVVVAEVLGTADPKGMVVTSLVRDLMVLTKDRSGRGVTGCVVFATWETPEGLMSRVNSTSEDGSTLLTQIPSSAQLSSNITIRAERMSVTVVRHFTFSPSIERWNVTLTCDVYDLTVRVADLTERPVAGAEVEASNFLVIARALTGADGRLTFTQLPAANYTIEAKFNLISSQLEVSLGSSADVFLTLPFLPSYNVTFHIVWNDGKAGSGLEALIRGKSLDTSSTTDESGNFTTVMPFGVYNITIIKGALIQGPFYVEVNTDALFEIQLNSSKRLNGLTVRLGTVLNQTVEGTVHVVSQGNELTSALTSGGIATFSLRDGDYKIWAEAPGYEATEMEISLSADREISIGLSPIPSPLSSPLISAGIFIGFILLIIVVAYWLYIRRS